MNIDSFDTRESFHFTDVVLKHVIQWGRGGGVFTLNIDSFDTRESFHFTDVVLKHVIQFAFVVSLKYG